MTSFLLWLLQFVNFLLCLGGILAIVFVVYMIRELKKEKKSGDKNENV